LLLILKENPHIALEIENQIRAKYNLPLTDTAKIEEMLENEA
jgi:hypothetical protein